MNDFNNNKDSTVIITYNRSFRYSRGLHLKLVLVAKKNVHVLNNKKEIEEKSVIKFAKHLSSRDEEVLRTVITIRTFSTKKETTFLLLRKLNIE